VLYNHRTLEKIWDTKNGAVNSYTRQPFDISYAISQIEQERDFLKKLISNFECLVHISNLGKRNMVLDLLSFWNALWQDFNLLRLYC
jgi:hypothetical protein